MAVLEDCTTKCIIKHAGSKCGFIHFLGHYLGREKINWFVFVSVYSYFVGFFSVHIPICFYTNLSNEN